MGLTSSGCQSQPPAESVDTTIEEGIREKSEAFSAAREQIALGTPASIERALDRISSADLGATDRGAELLYIARELYRIVYPYLDFPGAEVAQLSETSLYRRLFTAVKEGRIPEVPEGEATFLTTMISTLVLLTTGERETVEEAAAMSEQLLTINPQSDLAQFLRGLALERGGESTGALERYRDVIERAPGCYPARIGIVRVLTENGRGEEALPHTEQLLERFETEREVLRLAVEVFLQLGNLERADDLVSSALGRYPEDSILLRKRAVLLERTGRAEQARRIIRVVEEREGETAESLLVRVRLLAEEGRLSSAVAAARRGTEQYSQSTPLQIELARLLLQQGRPGEARRILDDVRETLPGDRQVASLLLEALIAADNWTAAREQLEELIDEKPAPDLLSKAIRIYRALDQDGRALEYAGRMVNEYPQRPEAIEEYVRLLLQMDRREEALQYIAERLRNTESSTLASQLYYLRSEVQTAPQERIESLQSALFENMQNKEALIALSSIYEQTGEYAKAVRYLRQAVSLNPRDEELKRRLRRLERQAR